MSRPSAAVGTIAIAFTVIAGFEIKVVPVYRDTAAVQSLAMLAAAAGISG